MNKEEKQKVIADLEDRFSRASAVVVAEYKGMTVAEMLDFRDNLRKFGIEYKVTKNTLAKRAANATGMSPVADSLTGPVGVAIAYDNPVDVARETLDFAKKNKKLVITGGVVEGKFCSVDELRAIAELPSVDVLRGMFAGAMASAISRMAYAMQAVVLKVPYAVEALKSKKEN